MRALYSRTGMAYRRIRNKRSIALAAAAGAAVAVLFHSNSLLAQTFPPDPNDTGYTDTATGSSNWSTGAWSLVVPTAGGAATDALWFIGGSTASNTGTASTYFDDEAAAGIFQLNSLWIGSNDWKSTITLTGSATNALYFTPTNGAGSTGTLPTVTLNGAGSGGGSSSVNASLTISENISLGLSTGQALTFQNGTVGTNGVTLLITSNITGAGDLAFNQTGSLTISGAIKTTGNLYFANTGAAALTSTAGISTSIANISFATNVTNVTLDGGVSNSGSATFSNHGNVSVTGNINNDALVISNDGSFTVGGGINAGTNSLVFGNTGAISIGGIVQNTSSNGIVFASGVTSISMSALNIPNYVGPLNLTNSGSFTLSTGGIASNFTNVSFSNNGSVTIFGGITNSGTLTIANNGSFVVSSGGINTGTNSLVFANSGTVSVSGTIQNTSTNGVTFLVTTGSNGVTTSKNTSISIGALNVPNYNGPLNLINNGAFALTAGGIASNFTNVNLNNRGAVSIAGDLSNSGNTTFGTAVGNVSLAGNLNSTGTVTFNNTGVVSLSGSGLQNFNVANAYTGGTLIQNGGVEASTATALGTGAVTNSGNLVGNFSGAVTNSVNFTGGTLYSANSSFQGLSGPVNIGTGGGNVNLSDYFTPATPRNMTISGTLSGTGSLTVTGSSNNAGTLYLSGTNTYAGGTGIQNGATLSVGSTAALGFGNIMTNGASLANLLITASNGGTLDLAGLNITEPITLAGGTLTNSSTNAATVNNGILASTFSASSSNFSSTSAVSFSGGGTGAVATLYLGFTNSSFNINGGSGYTGTSVPTVTFSTKGAIVPAAATAVVNTNTGMVTGLDITSAGEYAATSIANVIVTFSGGGTHTSSATASVNNGNFVLAGLQQTNSGSGYTSAPTLTFGAPTATTSTVLGNVLVTASSSIGGNYGNITVAGLFSGSNSNAVVTKIGSDTLYLNGANTFAGGLVIAGGNVVSQNGSGFGQNNSSGAIILGGGSLAITDDGGTAGGSNQTITYGNNVNVTGSNTLSVSPSSSGQNNTIAFGSLALSNNASLGLNSTSGYAVAFSGVTGGGTLSGTAPLTVSGSVAPGDAPAVLNITSTNFSLSNSASYSPEIAGGPGWAGSNATNAGVTYDQLNMIAGTGLAINGATLNLRMSGTNSLVAGDEYFLVNETVAPTGSPAVFGQVEFNGTPVLSIGAGPDGGQEYVDPTNSEIIYELDYTGNITTGDLTSGQDVVLDVISVPEPSSLGLLGFAAMALLAKRRRRADAGLKSRK